MTLDDALPSPVPRPHWRLDSGALVPWGYSLFFDDVDAFLAERDSWVPDTKPKRYASLFSPGYGG